MTDLTGCLPDHGEQGVELAVTAGAAFTDGDCLLLVEAGHLAAEGVR